MRWLLVWLSFNGLVSLNSATAETKNDVYEAGWVPAQTFLMGDALGSGRPDQRPAHPVTLAAFYIAPRLVTVQEYCDFLNASAWDTEEGTFIVRQGGGEVLVNLPYAPMAKENERYVPKPGAAQQPMYYVTWEGSALYCNYLSEKEGLSPCYHPDSKWACDFSANGYHLPTEAQWECAARGDQTGRVYPTGDSISPQLANFDGVVGRIVDVGSYPPNEYGLFDMAGNIMQWCNDWYRFDYYASCESGIRNPIGPREDELTGHAVRVLRGGTYYHPAEFQTCASRYGTADTKGCFSFNGFRVAREAPMRAPDYQGAEKATRGSEPEMRRVADWIQAHFLQHDDKPVAFDKLPLSFHLGGKLSAEFLDEWQFTATVGPAEPGQRRIDIVGQEPGKGLELKIELTTFDEFPAVEWVAHLANRGSQDTPVLENVRALDCAFERSPEEQREFILRHSRGSRATGLDFVPEDELLPPLSKRVLGGHGGRPSDYSMPFMNFAWNDGGTVLAIGWSGQWQATFQRDSGRALRVSAGMERTHLKLHAGESIRTPRIVLLFWNGEDLIRGHNLFRQLVLAHYAPRIDGQLVIPPIAASAAGLNGYSEENQLAAAPKYAQRGIEVQWIDAGWFVGGWPNGAGNWTPKPVEFPRGLGPVGEAVHAAGMKFLLWFEIERVSRGSRIEREHPEWTIGPITEYGGLFNWGIPEARRWMTDLVLDQLERGRVDIFRMDFNMEPLMYWWRNDPPDRQGITEIRFVEGMYEMWDELRKRRPGLWIDNCASGGRMFDLETVRRSISLTQSDAPYEPDRTASRAAIGQLQNAGLNLYLPFHSGVCFGIEPSYDFRSAMMSGNVLNVNVIETPVEKMKQTVATYQKVRPYFEGDYYPLFRHRADEASWFGYQLHRPDRESGMVVVFRRSLSLVDRMTVLLEGLDPDARYRLVDHDSSAAAVISGRALRALLIELPQAPGAKLLFYEKE